ncbi:long-chain fatty acid--CoA ligase [Sandaracinobacter neustonicus]|uniref:Long-chain fatty acid--CoA ligase n=1 Tax=Sandaracinobacter neustonicus TaxID=1715348 RepID=A0A501XQT4_9SPHN|nr:AMP-binding protein [Sandaracinobacter neustonicus]TPE62683.1 long-chain fatty acid--CoA ligase [Sandaracinobacter neustonicus]
MTETWPAMSIAQANALLTAPGAPFEMEVVEIEGRPTRSWKNAPPTLQHCFAAGRAHGERIFLVHEEERVSYEGFARATLRLADHLKSLGVGRGDRVAIAMRNVPEWPVAFYAGQLLGAIVTPLNAWWTGPELEYGLSDSGAKLLIADGDRWERIAPHRAALPDLQHVLISRSGDGSLEAVIGAPGAWGSLPDLPTPAPFLHPDDDATIFYTSGTTGKPKGALGTHRNICSNVMSGAFSGARSFLRRGEMPPQPDPAAPQKATLLSVPFFHATGCHAILNPSLVGGARLVMQRKFDAGDALRLIEAERITSAGGVPTIAWQILTHPDRDKYDLSSLETISYGGAPSAPELVRQIGAAGSAPGNGWGMTETSATFCHHMAEDYLHRPDSCGPAVPVCDAEIRDADGNVLPVGEVGELYGFGPNIVKAYWNKPEASAETFPGGWVRSGDLARIDSEGFVSIVDRAKDMLIRGGENIYCVEVEGVLCEHPAVMDAALVGRPHHVLGEEPVAFVSTKPHMQVGEAELQAFAAERLARFKVPVEIFVRHQPLPRNANGKILKNELKKEVA